MCYVDPHGDEYQSCVDGLGMISVGETEASACERESYGITFPDTIAHAAGWLRTKTQAARIDHGFTSAMLAKIYTAATGIDCSNGEMICALDRAEITLVRRRALDAHVHAQIELVFASL